MDFGFKWTSVSLQAWSNEDLSSSSSSTRQKAMLRARHSGQFCPREAREGCSRDTWISGTRSVKSENKKMRLPNDWWPSAATHRSLLDSDWLRTLQNSTLQLYNFTTLQLYNFTNKLNSWPAHFWSAGLDHLCCEVYVDNKLNDNMRSFQRNLSWISYLRYDFVNLSLYEELN